MWLGLARKERRLSCYSVMWVIRSKLRNLFQRAVLLRPEPAVIMLMPEEVEQRVFGQTGNAICKGRDLYRVRSKPRLVCCPCISLSSARACSFYLSSVIGGRRAGDGG